MTTCPNCKTTAKVIVTESQPNPVVKRRGPWSFCHACIAREQDLGDERAVAAINEAERSGA